MATATGSKREWLSAEQVRERLGISNSTFYRLRARKVFKAHSLPGSRLRWYDWAEVERAMRPAR